MNSKSQALHLLVFGGAGFIGSNVVREALARGHRVTVADNLSRRGVEENVAHFVAMAGRRYRFIHLDIRCQTDFEKLRASRFDCCINFAANPAVPVSIANPLFDFESNAMGHLYVLEYAARRSLPVILASSNKVFTDKLNTIPLQETATRYVPLQRSFKGFNEATDVDGHEGFTNSPYGVSKLAAEKYTREYWVNHGLPIVINRMSCVYGEFQKGVEDQGWVDWFLRAKKFGWPVSIFGNGKQVRDVVFGADVAKLYVDQAERIHEISGMTFVVGGGVRSGFQISLIELLTLIDTEFPGKRLKISFSEWRKSDQRLYMSDISKVRRVMGWRPTTKLIDGLRIMWEQYRV